MHRHASYHPTLLPGSGGFLTVWAGPLELARTFGIDFFSVLNRCGAGWAGPVALT
jgi:hypothetical protein